MKPSTIEKCQKAHDLILSGMNQSQAMKKVKMGVNTYYEFLGSFKKPKAESKRKVVRASFPRNIPLIQRVLSSDLSEEDKIVICSSFVG